MGVLTAHTARVELLILFIYGIVNFKSSKFNRYRPRNGEKVNAYRIAEKPMGKQPPGKLPCKVKVKSTLQPDRKVERGSRGITILFLNLSTR